MRFISLGGYHYRYHTHALIFRSPPPPPYLQVSVGEPDLPEIHTLGKDLHLVKLLNGVDASRQLLCYVPPPDDSPAKPIGEHCIPETAYAKLARPLLPLTPKQSILFVGALLSDPWRRLLICGPPDFRDALWMR